VPGANRELRAAVVQDRAAAVVQSRVLLVQMEIPTDAVVRALQLARKAGALTVLNPAPAVHVPAAALLAADIVVPNEHEAARLGGATALLDAGAHVVVVTEGKRGAEVITREHRHRVPPFLVNPVDTVAAGDAFCGALAARLAAGDDVDAALRWAAAAGALATTVHGAVPSLPRYGDVAALVSGTR
jgi:ribokinase